MYLPIKREIKNLMEEKLLSLISCWKVTLKIVCRVNHLRVKHFLKAEPLLWGEPPLRGDSPTKLKSRSVSGTAF